ncbi:MAG TPA: IS3 family transposase, partial [Acidimicrobiales bacterium]|nr:IS3 family transposase [Acidimicrobiales bacterium]
MIDPELELPVSSQCRLLSVPRSTYYYERRETESDENLVLMQAIDQLYLAHPENGSRLMTKVLRRRG